MSDALTNVSEWTFRLREILGGLERLLASRSAEDRSSPLRELERRLRALELRLREGPEAPIRIAIFGPTGAGKSKIFNSLVGRELSPSGYRRPFTRKSVYLVHESKRRLVEPSAREIRTTSDEAWRDCVLIDSTDFDSVEAENREEAEAIFDEAEAFIFVAEAQKYADRATWEYLRRIYERAGPLALVLNKVVSETEARDFSLRLAASFGEDARSSELISIPDLPLGDAALLPLGEPPMQKLLEAIQRIAGSPAERRSLRARKVSCDLDAALETWKRSRERLIAYAEGLSGLSERLERRFRSALGELPERLETEVDPGLKAELYARLLERIERIDVLRYPRKLLALPFRGLNKFLARWFRSRRRALPDGSREPRSLAFEGFESLVLRLAEETLRDFAAEARCPGLVSEKDIAALKPRSEELRAIYEEREAAFREWLEREAFATASELTTHHKLKFFLAQLLYNAIIVGFQVHTAGGFTLLEGLTDAVVSPLVAKAAGIAVSREAVAQFANEARAEHVRLLSALVADSKKRFERHLELAGSWRGDFEAVDRGMSQLAEARDRILAPFRGGAHEV